MHQAASKTFIARFWHVYTYWASLQVQSQAHAAFAHSKTQAQSVLALTFVAHYARKGSVIKPQAVKVVQTHLSKLQQGAVLPPTDGTHSCAKH